ncbi:MAG: cell wall hydrolase [Methylococcales bacterium]
MTSYFNKQFTCLVPMVISLLIIGGVVYVQGFKHPLLVSSVASSHEDSFADQQETDEESEFLDVLSSTEIIPSATTTNIAQQQQVSVSLPQILNSFNSYVKSLSGQYNVLAPYLQSHNSGEQSEGVYSLSELQCMALNLYFEARGETSAGQKAVAHVVLNRVNHAGFPKSVCDVVKQGGQDKRYHCQFSWWCDGLSDKPGNKRSWRQSVVVAAEVLLEKTNDPTNGALWYHADYASPYWRRSMEKGPTIGKHIFYSSKKTRPILSAST